MSRKVCLVVVAAAILASGAQVVQAAGVITSPYSGPDLLDIYTDTVPKNQSTSGGISTPGLGTTLDPAGVTYLKYGGDQTTVSMLDGVFSGNKFFMGAQLGSTTAANMDLNSPSPSSGGGWLWWDAHFTFPMRIDHFVIRTADAASSRTPDQFQLRGSNDGGATWNLIYRLDANGDGSGTPWGLNPPNATAVQFDRIGDSFLAGAYNEIRLEVFSATNNGDGVGLTEWQLAGGTAFTAAITLNGTPGSPSDWATGATWDLGGTDIPGSTHAASVRHSVTLAAGTAQSIATLALDNAASDLRIATGATLSAIEANVPLGSMVVDGTFNTSKLIVEGGAITLATGSAGTIPTLNVTSGSATVDSGSTAVISTVAVSAGSATLSGGTIGTLNASGGTTGLDVSPTTALNVSGTAAVTSSVSVSTTGAVSVSGGSLGVTGGITASGLTFSGGALTQTGAINVGAGTVTMSAAGGSLAISAGSSVGILNASNGTTSVTGGSVTTVNVSGGAASLSGGTIGTVTASGGTTTLSTSVTTLNANSGAAILTGPGAAVGTAVLKTGSTVDTQGNYLAVNTKVTLNGGMEISASGAAADVKGASGDNIGDASKISRLRLNGGTVSVFKPGAGPETLLMSEGFETDGQGTRYASNTNLADPAAVASTANTMGLWGRVTSVPTVAHYSNGSSPTEGSVMWMGEDTAAGSTTQVPNSRTSDGMERSGAWLDLNALSVAGKTGLRLTVDLMASGNASGSGPETNDEFKIRVKDVATGITTDVEYMEGQNNAPYKSKMPGSTTQLNTPGVAVSKSYDIAPMAGNIQLTFAHSQNGSNGVEYLAFDNIKLYGRDIVADPIVLSSTTVELNAAFSTMDIGAAASADFLDLVFAAGRTENSTLRVKGSNATAVTNLANYFDLTAANAANVYNIGSGADYIDLEVRTYVAPVWHDGDVNQDGQVSLLDYNIIKVNFGNVYGDGTHWTDGDVNADGQVGLLDFNIVKAHFGHTTGDTGVTAVPEPATLSLLALAGLAALRRKR